MKSVAVLLICGIVLCLAFVILVPEGPRPAASTAPSDLTPPEVQAMDRAMGKAAPPSDIKDLQITDVVVGDGEVATPGKRLTVHYTGWLYDSSLDDRKGLKFDSSVGQAAFSFNLGRGEVIPGWDEGMQGMKVGGKRTLIIPPHVAYGPSGMPPKIPGNATLMFEVELKDVN
ncbi:MAG: FKBP-type peptidyl-prolyl cis-trans isomerase [Pirellulales bacterium]